MDGLRVDLDGLGVLLDHLHPMCRPVQSLLSPPFGYDDGSDSDNDYDNNYDDDDSGDTARIVAIRVMVLFNIGIWILGACADLICVCIKESVSLVKVQATQVVV